MPIPVPIRPVAVNVDVPPLLLLPMRLEYRVVEAGSTATFVNTAAERVAFRQGALQQGGLAHRRLVAEAIKKPFVTVRPTQAATEIWFRWYPDDGFVENGIAPQTAEETALLARFRAQIGARKWWDVADAGVSAAWQALARSVGPARAVHLLRTTAADSAWESRVGRIAALPDRVELFALKGSTLTSIGKGGAIPKNTAQARSAVSYTYTAIETGGWIADFRTALELGMGVRVTDAAAVAGALAAEWIVAVGISGDAGVAEIESLLRDRIANGEFEILPQDAATNNSPGDRSILVDPRQDLNGFMGIAAQSENGALAAASGDTASSLLSFALGIDPGVLKQAVRAADGALEDARAMLRVIGPALIDEAIDGVPALQGIDEYRFIEAIAGTLSARGVLPPIRSGRNAYGIVTMGDVRTLKTTATDEVSKKVHEFLRTYAGLARQHAPAHADQVVPVLQPDDPAASDKLESILKAAAVSVRVDVADAGSGDTTSIGCPYVEGTADDRKPGAYLKALRTVPVDQLADPTSADRTWPLLYRLARQALTRNTLLPVVRSTSTAVTSTGALDRLTPAERTAIDADLKTASKLSLAGFADLKTTAFPKVQAAALQTIKTVNLSFTAALKRLEAIAGRDSGTAALETLMMEVIDLFQHRVDAWATGLAFDAVRARRQKSPKAGLRAGYFGFLGKLRPKSATGTTNGFIQAPSMGQATAAAVLRSAFLRHRAQGAFAVNLRSKRARRAMGLLDLLKKGNSLNEALGMRGERWLHDVQASRLTATLRSTFPIRNVSAGDGVQPAQRRVFDGLAFLEGAMTGLAAADATAIAGLKRILADDLDALSDLIVAEAVYQRGLGASDAANAWLQVLSGEPVPGDPMILRTQRSGQGSTYRVSLLLDDAPVSSPAAPRSIAEPSLAALAARTLAGFDGAAVTLKVSRVSNPSQQTTMSVTLRDGLGLTPIDLVIGGTSELQLRVRHWLLEQWLRQGVGAAALGSIPATGLDAFLNSHVEVSIDLSLGSPSVQTLVGRAETLRRMAQQGRAIEPADLNAAASPAPLLDEATEIRITAGAVEQLRARARALVDRLTADVADLAGKRGSFARRAAIAASSQGPSDVRMTARVEAEAARRDLIDVCRRVSAWAEPTALRTFTLDEGLAGLSAVEERLAQLETRLGDRLTRLSTALSATASSNHATLADARAALRTMVEALRAALDGDAIPILPPYERADALRPELLAAADPATHLAAWTAVRPATAAAVAAALDASMRAYPVSESATADDTGSDPDPRTESRAPRSRHFGVLLGTDRGVRSSPRIAGIVVDEWAEQRPSEMQSAAVAVNYDSPQSEPPQVLLLCAPPALPWTEKAAAEMVAETIAWMKIRALATTDKLTPSSLMPKGNRVPYKKVGTALEPRIPPQRFALVAKPWFEGEGLFVRGDATGPIGAAAAGLNQRRGFFRVKE